MRAFVINNLNLVEHLINKNFILEENHTNDLFLTFSYSIFLKFKDNNVNCLILDNHLELQEAKQVTLDVFHLAKSWWKTNDSKLGFEYDGIPLDECSMLDFISSKFIYFFRIFYNLDKIFNKYKIDKIFYDDVLSDVVCECCKVYGIKHEKIKYDITDETFTGYFNYVDFSKLSVYNNISVHKILMLKTIYYFKKSWLFLTGKTRKKKVFISVYNVTYSLLKAIYEKYIYFIIGKFPSIDELLNIKYIVDFFYSIDNKPELKYNLNYFDTVSFKKKFIFNNKDCSGFFCNEIKSYYKNNYSLAINVVENIKKYLLHNKINFIILPFDCTFIDRVIVYLAKINNIKTIKLQHGICFTDTHLDSSDGLTDYVFAISPQDYFHHFKHTENKLMMSSPLYDFYSGSRHRHDKNKSKFELLINPYHSSEYIYETSVYEEELFVYEVLASLRRYKNRFNITFRIHPGLSCKHFQYLISNFFSDLDVEITNKGDFFEVITRYDLFISWPSTTVLEAAAAGVPSIFYNQNNHNWKTPFDIKNLDLPQATSISGLESLLEKYLNHFSEKDWFIDPEIIRKYGIVVDGKNSKRIIKKIEDIVS